MTEEVTEKLKEQLKGMTQEEVVDFAIMQFNAMEKMADKLEEKQGPSQLPDALPTANYFKINTMKYSMEFNSSDATLPDIVENAIKVIGELNPDNLQSMQKQEYGDGLV